MNSEWPIYIFIFILFLLFPISLHLTGKVERQYDVLSPEETIFLKNIPVSVEYIAMKYLPEFYTLIELQKPEPEKITYEIIHKDGNISIVYRLHYPNEIGPLILIDQLYSMFRIFYYGSKKDIEFVQIDVNKDTGEIIRIQFETSQASPISLIQIHKPVKIIKRDDGNYLMNIGKKHQYLQNLPLNETHLQIAIVTWNHLFSLRNNKINYKKIDGVGFVFLDDKSYRDNKMIRRSAGDFR